MIYLGVFHALFIFLGVINPRCFRWEFEAPVFHVQVVEPTVENKIEPWQQLKGVRAHEEHILHSYAWVDQKEGTVRIPIDRAIDILSQKGLPTHDYLQDIMSGKKPPMPAQQQQGNKNAPK